MGAISLIACAFGVVRDSSMRAQSALSRNDTAYCFRGSDNQRKSMFNTIIILHSAF